MCRFVLRFLLANTHSCVIALVAAVASQPVGAQESPSPNPISKIARLFDARLVEVEERVVWLDRRLSTYSRLDPIPLRFSLGYRGCRMDPRAADPAIAIDLGASKEIDAIYLVPAQREFIGDSGIFPKRFTLEASNDEQFAQRSVIFSSGASPYPPPESVPQFFRGKGSARYIRLSVQEGHQKGKQDLYGLAELVVISKNEPVSFQASVTTSGDLNVPHVWFPQALVDGQTPLGIWHNGTHVGDDRGDLARADASNEYCVWSIPLPAAAPIDRVVIFPYPLHRSAQTRVMPQSMELRLATENPNHEVRVWEWETQLPGGEHPTPTVVPLAGQFAKSVVLISKKPWQLGDDRIHAVSEIEVWSGGRNLAAGITATRTFQGTTLPINSLTDGSSGERKIIPVDQWFKQLHDRGSMERELASLRPLHRQLASRSELNTTWGAAVLMGLTFLIPVFIFERRRLMSREQLDLIRKRIASDLHDDIGSNLGSISMIARTARRDLVRMNGPEQVADDLNEVETIARESSLAMRDIVWLLERRLDSVGDLVQRMRETANRLMRDIEFHLDCHSEKTAARLSLDAKRHLFLFYKESLHNILKHSHASVVNVRIWDEDDQLCIEISDNGIGVPQDPGQRPAAMTKLEDRARLLRGTMQVSSAKNQGTHIRLAVKRCYLTSNPSKP